MGTTIESSAVTAADLERELSPELYARTMALYDAKDGEIQRYRAGRYGATADRNKAVGGHYKAVIEGVLALFPAEYDCHRARDVLDHMRKYPPSHFGLKELPTERTVRKYVMQHYFG